MGFGHIGAHDENTIAVGQVLLISGRGAAAEGCAQTGHRCAVSDARLVFNADDAQATSKEFLQQIVLLIVDGGSTKTANAAY